MIFLPAVFRRPVSFSAKLRHQVPDAEFPHFLSGLNQLVKTRVLQIQDHLHQHGQVHPGDQLHPLAADFRMAQKGGGDIEGRSAEQIYKDQEFLPLLQPGFQAFPHALRIIVQRKSGQIFRVKEQAERFLQTVRQSPVCHQNQQIADPKVRASLDALTKTGDEEAYQNALAAARLKQWRNRVISDGYEPGSTFKVLTMAAALDCGAIDLNTPFYCRGAEQIPGRAQRLHCWRSAGHGAEKTPQALQNSCNIAFAHIALKLGGERFYEYVQRFGVLEKTGIDLAGESRGVFFDKALVTDTEKWGTASLTSGSFGQTFKLTPLQLVRAIASVVNGGELLEPYLVSEVLDGEGNTVLRQEPTVTRRTIQQSTSETMRTLIRSVVTEGTAKNAAVPGYSVGGKTGTSEKIDVFDENGQRVQDKIVSFVGIAPMEDPEYIVLAALDTPSRATGIYISGGVMAAPTVGAVLQDILPYLGVEKTDLTEEEARTLSVPDFRGLTRTEAEKQMKALGLTSVRSGTKEQVTAQIPAPGTQVQAGSQVLLYFGGEPETVRVPDFSGMNRQQAEDAASKAGVTLRISGNPEVGTEIIAVFQQPAAGEQAERGTEVTVQFADRNARD